MMHNDIVADGFYHTIKIQAEPVLLQRLHYKNNISRTIWSDGTVMEDINNEPPKVLFKFNNKKDLQEALQKIEAYFKQDKTIE